VALAVEFSVVRDLNLAAGAGRDAWGNTHLDQTVAKPIGSRHRPWTDGGQWLDNPICQQRPGLRKRGRQRPCPDAIRGLACGQEHADRAAFCIGKDVQFRVQPIFHAPDRPSPVCKAPAFSTARLDAVRCALRRVASIIAVPVCRACTAGSVMILANTPIRLHRFQRL